MPVLNVQRHSDRLCPDITRVILRPFLPGPSLIDHTLRRIAAMGDEAVADALSLLLDDYSCRHRSIKSILLSNYALVQDRIDSNEPITDLRRLYIGAHFSGEYALESAALFNPSMVPHPDQTGLPIGALRFIMSLRATGEGHISSIEFRSGHLLATNEISWDPVGRFVSTPSVACDPRFHRSTFLGKLHEMDCDGGLPSRFLDSLDEWFSLSQLRQVIQTTTEEHIPCGPSLGHALDCVQWLADSNYEVEFHPQIPVSERTIVPVTEHESNGIEDARFVRFTDEDGSSRYYATYTAYNGNTILPQLMVTDDFLSFRIITLNGTAIQNKGMALFPRRIDGRYAMLSRQDDENIFIMFSENLHFWNDPVFLLGPEEEWESVKIGNCGSPIETEAGWLVMTHGVGPMRTYCIGAALLDRNDPTQVIGRLRVPLIHPHGREREGYVPNVVYSCGSLLHGDRLIIPYAVSDRETAVASVAVSELIAMMQQ